MFLIVPCFSCLQTNIIDLMSEPIPTSGENFGDFQGAGAQLKSPTSPTAASGEEDGSGWDNFVSARTDSVPQPGSSSSLPPSGKAQKKWVTLLVRSMAKKQLIGSWINAFSSVAFIYDALQCTGYGRPIAATKRKWTIENDLLRNHCLKDLKKKTPFLLICVTFTFNFSVRPVLPWQGNPLSDG